VHSAEKHPRLSDLTSDQIRGRAREYRTMAANVACTTLADALRRLADRYDRLAEENDVGHSDAHTDR